MTSFDPLDGIPLDVEARRASGDPLADLPITVADSPDILNYGGGDDEQNTVVLSARVPESWLVIIDDLRQAPNTPFPNVWPRRSRFIKWAIYRGIQEANLYRRSLDTEHYDPMAEAHMFADRVNGRLKARSEIVEKTRATVSAMALAISQLIDDDELYEAADYLQEYMEGASKLSSFWQSYTIKQLLDNADLAKAIDVLNRQGVLSEGPLLDVAVTRGLTTRVHEEE